MQEGAPAAGIGKCFIQHGERLGITHVGIAAGVAKRRLDAGEQFAQGVVGVGLVALVGIDVEALAPEPSQHVDPSTGAMASPGLLTPRSDTRQHAMQGGQRGEVAVAHRPRGAQSVEQQRNFLVLAQRMGSTQAIETPRERMRLDRRQPLFGPGPAVESHGCG